MTRHFRSVRISHLTIAFFTVILFAVEPQAATFEARYVGRKATVVDINNKGEYIGRKPFPTAAIGAYVYLPDSAYGLAAGFTHLLIP